MKFFDGCKVKLVLFGFVAAVLIGGGGSAKADFIFGTPTNLGPTVNSSTWDLAPSISSDGLTLYFSSYYRPGGYGSWDLWVTTRATTEDDWGTPVNLGPPVNTSADDVAQSFSVDDLSLYFESNRPGGSGDRDIWVTTRATTEDDWGTPVNLGPTVNSSNSDGAPRISADDLSLYFSSRRPGGYGNYDIWVTTRATTSDPWEEPVNLGPPVNTSADEIGPRISPDGRTLFFCEYDSGPFRPGGLGGADIWVTTRATVSDPWGTPVNLGPPVNTSADELSQCISADGLTLYFASRRPGGYGNYDIWQAPIIPIVDFNGDGRVDFKDFSILALFWFQDESSVEIAPGPFGDHIVNFKDVGVFAENWLWLSSTRQASNPNPDDDATGIDIDADLSWTPGYVAALHEVYFGSDPCALPLVATQPAGQDSYDPPGDLIPSTTYYWRIDEVNDAGPPPGNWPGVLWSFTTESGKAYSPDPFHEAVVGGEEEPAGSGHLYVPLGYQPGPTAVKHTGYFSENKDDVANRIQDANMGEPPYAPGWPDGNDVPPPFNESLVRGTTYYWCVDEADNLGNVFCGDIWEFTVRGFKAFNPDPADKAEYVDPNADVSWGAGFDVDFHDVYFGTDFDDVNNAVCTTAVGGVYKGCQSAGTITYDPGPLELNTKYFWRIDEVTNRTPFINPCGGDILTGDVWSFTTGVPSPP